MKGYKRFILIFIALLAIYIAAEMNRPEEVDWSVTLSAKDKNPYGGFILYQQLKDIFPNASISSNSLPLYNQINNFDDNNTAYLLIEPDISLGKEDVEELLNYVVSGNYVFMASANFNKLLMDSLKFSMKDDLRLLKGDSTTINFKNPNLHAHQDYGYRRLTLDRYFNKFDTANTIVLGANQFHKPNFIKMPYGEGAFFIHALPLCFSNDFMLTRANAAYTAKALSYVPKKVHTLFWDEYYKRDEHAPDTPLRFILNNTWLNTAFWIGLVTMLLFVLFEMKRRQRPIAVIVPLQNSTLDFVKTVGNVYFNQRDNKNIALKQISYFLESVRSNSYLSTNSLDDQFIQALSKKMIVPEEKVILLVKKINEIQQAVTITDEQLLELNKQIDYFNSLFNG